MQDHQIQFIQTALKSQVLKFGEFKLKSGRISPYFFNAGLFNTGEALYQVAHAYAQAIVDSGIEYDVLFGPAYKGIPLVAAISTVLAAVFEQNVGFAYNRKEAKDHGEGGVLVGADMTGKRVLVIDDVITAGTAITEALGHLKPVKANIVGVFLALDRQERGLTSEKSAVQELESQYSFPVHAIVGMSDIMDYLENFEVDDALLATFQDYREQYGAK